MTLHFCCMGVEGEAAHGAAALVTEGGRRGQLGQVWAESHCEMGAGPD
jgi:hypothetical protein